MFYFSYVGVAHLFLEWVLALTQHEEANHITWVEKLVSLLGVERIDFKPYCYSQLTKICARCKIILSMTENPLQYRPLHLKRANTL